MRVYDGWLWSEPDVAFVTVAADALPVAIITLPQGDSVNVGQQICLDGTQSYDSEGPVTYEWGFNYNPGTAMLDDPTASVVCFTPDVPGDYVIQLMVVDSMEQTSEIVTEAIIAIGEEMPGDIDGDGNVDMNDYMLVIAARNQPADGPDDPRDIDGDGVITVLDARALILMCTCPRCAIDCAP